MAEIKCRWCGAVHGPLCPYVKALEFDRVTGLVVRVEFITPRDCVSAPSRSTDEEPDYPRYVVPEIQK